MFCDFSNFRRYEPCLKGKVPASILENIFSGNSKIDLWIGCAVSFDLGAKARFLHAFRQKLAILP